MTIAMQPIYTQTLSGAAASVTFNNIPQTFTDLKVVISARSSDSTGQGTIMRFNGSTTTYSNTYLFANGSSASSSRLTYNYVGSIFGTNGTANTFNNTEIHIPNYTGSSFKASLCENTAANNNTLGYLNLLANLWRSTDAITSISFLVDGGSNFVQHSTFSIYGITKG